MQANARRKEEKKRTHEFMYYCSIFYAIQFMACYLSGAGTIFAFFLSCLYLYFGLSVETRDTRSTINVTSQCTRICKFFRFVCITYARSLRFSTAFERVCMVQIQKLHRMISNRICAHTHVRALVAKR